MIVSRTPYRISFFGGGTDYPAWFNDNKGAVLSAAINKYCYINCRYLPPYFDYKYSIVYSRREDVNELHEIKHHSVRECLKFMDVNSGLVIHHDGDLPARTGIGSSSSFTVGLLNALYALNGRMVSKKHLALNAIEVEQDIIKENVGSQDQTIAAFGGINKITFERNNNIEVQQITYDTEKIDFFHKHLMLFFTGFSRTASEIAHEQIKETPKKASELSTMYSMVESAISILKNITDAPDEMGQLLHEGWKLKRSLTSRISTIEIDDIYETARRAGATGGKLLGAGGGGFMVFYVKPELQHKVMEALKNLLYVPFRFDTLGSQIIYFGPENSYRHDKNE
ncbi:kinase [Candidatus Latescibacterota bacterium]